MNFLSWLLLILVALWLVAAVFHIVRRRGGCSCGGCGGACDRCVGCAMGKGEKCSRKRCG